MPKRRHIKFSGQGITQKKEYNIQNTAKVGNQEFKESLQLFVQGGVLLVLLSKRPSARFIDNADGNFSNCCSTLDAVRLLIPTAVASLPPASLKASPSPTWSPNGKPHLHERTCIYIYIILAC
jgi:hypothetical protein